MSRGFGRAAGVGFVASFVAACTLTTDLDGFTGGSASGDGGVADSSAPPSDGSGSTSSSSGAINGCDPTGCVAVPAGFNLIAYGPKGAACPNNFSMPFDGVESPSVANGACACSCKVGQKPTCPATGAMPTTWGPNGDGACGNNGGTTSASCATDGFLGAFGTGNEHNYAPPAPTGGTCDSSVVKDMQKLVLGAESRSCAADQVPTCNGMLCPGSMPSFSACVAAAGDVSCPPAFPQKHLVGDNASFDCSNACTCTLTSSCAGQLQFFPTTNCSGAPGMVVKADGTCQPTVSSPVGTSYGSHKYVPDPVNAACNVGGSSSPTVRLDGKLSTVCCP